VKEAFKDEETLEFVKEDAEQADNAAMLARQMNGIFICSFHMFFKACEKL
jgi:hypothetical protein